MPRSSGTFTASSSSVNPAVKGTPIDETDFNALIDDIESALTDSVYTAGLGSTDNRLVRTDGTDTKKVQGTGITVDDSNNVTGVVGLTATTVSATTVTATTANTTNGTQTGYLDVAEMSAPSSPSANIARVYAYDDGAGVTKMAFKDSAGNITTLGSSGGGSGDVTAASNFGTDNSLIRSDGTTKGVQASGITVDDSNNVTGAANLVTLTGSQTLTNKTLTAPTITAPVGVDSVNAGALAGFRNKIVNGCFRINQRRLTSVGDDAYCFDRWYLLAQSGACAISQLTNIEDGTPYGIRITQSQASAQRFGLAQIITAGDSIDLRGAVATLMARVRMSASTTLRYAILEWTGTANSVTSDWVLNWSSGTFTAGNFFTSTSTTVAGTGSTALTANTLTDLTKLSASISSSANNVAVLIWTDSAQAQNVTLDIAKAQLEPGSTASKFERRPISTEDALCAPHLFKSWSDGTAIGTAFSAGADQFKFSHPSASFSSTFALPVKMFSSSPTLTVYDAAGTSNKVSYFNGSAWVDGGTITSSAANDKFVFVQHTMASSIFTNFAVAVECEL